MDKGWISSVCEGANTENFDPKIYFKRYHYFEEYNPYKKYNKKFFKATLSKYGEKEYCYQFHTIELRYEKNEEVSQGENFKKLYYITAVEKLSDKEHAILKNYCQCGRHKLWFPWLACPCCYGCLDGNPLNNYSIYYQGIVDDAREASVNAVTLGSCR